MENAADIKAAVLAALTALPLDDPRWADVQALLAPQPLELTPAQIAELQRRADEIDAGLPTIPMEEARAYLRERRMQRLGLKTAV